MDIPIIVICYNNYKYVDNTLKQIFKINFGFESSQSNGSVSCFIPNSSRHMAGKH